MTEKDLLIQTQRRKIDDLTKELEAKDRLIDVYSNLIESAVLGIDKTVSVMEKALGDINAYISSVDTNENR